MKPITILVVFVGTIALLLSAAFVTRDWRTQQRAMESLRSGCEPDLIDRLLFRVHNNSEKADLIFARLHRNKNITQVECRFHFEASGADDELGPRAKRDFLNLIVMEHVREQPPVWVTAVSPLYDKVDPTIRIAVDVDLIDDFPCDIIKYFRNLSPLPVYIAVDNAD